MELVFRASHLALLVCVQRACLTVSIATLSAHVSDQADSRRKNCTNVKLLE
ncbi:rCG39199 [Rattus norvegicus]|uniref:RCG39199 n=1 Tax=Rattus norvegicus TaxID=10116 RepID=A6KMJ4_RAT|nr:rCG39199 [Rattus norvegicus]